MPDILIPETLEEQVRDAYYLLVRVGKAGIIVEGFDAAVRKADELAQFERVTLYQLMPVFHFAPQDDGAVLATDLMSGGEYTRTMEKQ